MAMKFDRSLVGYTPNLSLFDAPPVDAATDLVQWQDYRPTNLMAKSSPIEFNIPGSSSHYLDLKRTRLYVKAKMTKPTGEKIGIDDKIAFTNLSLHSMFRQVDVSLQQQIISPGVGTCYAYKAYFDTILDSENNNNPGILQSQLFYKDSAHFMEDVDIIGQNKGFSARCSLTLLGQSVDMEGGIFSDLCQQDRLLLNGVPVRVKLFPNTDPFVIMSSGAADYEFQIEDAVLKVCQVSLNPGIIVGHSEALLKSPALYPYNQSNIKSYTIPTGSFSWEADDIYQGNVPSRMVIALTTAAAFSGSYNKNPYNFHHQNLNFIGLYVNNQSIPSQPLTPNYKNNCYVNSYFTLIKDATKSRSDFINRVDFNGGYAIYLFSMKEKEGEAFTQLQRKGHTRLSMRFAEAPTEPLTVVVYSHFPAMLTIDQSRNVTLS